MSMHVRDEYAGRFRGKVLTGIGEFCGSILWEVTIDATNFSVYTQAIRAGLPRNCGTTREPLI